MQTADQAKSSILFAVTLVKPKLLATIEDCRGATIAESDALENKLSYYGGCRINTSPKANEMQSQLATSLGKRGEFGNATAHLAAQEAYFATDAGRLRGNLALHAAVMNAINENRANGVLFNPYKTPWKDFDSFWEANGVQAPQPRPRRRLSESRPMPPTATPEMAVS